MYECMYVYYVYICEFKNIIVYVAYILSKISYKDRVTNNEVLHRVKEGLHFFEGYEKEETDAWRALNERIQWRNTSIYKLLEGKVKGKQNRGTLRLTWMNDVIEWTGLKTYENVKRTAEDRDKWRAIVVKLL